MQVNDMLAYVFGLFPHELVSFIVWYGNKHGRDIDLFVVLNNETVYYNRQQDKFDVNIIGEYYLPKMITGFDPIVTEPLLTGQLIYGNDITGFQKELQDKRADEETTRYLICCAGTVYGWAINHLVCNNLRGVIVNLGFVASYLFYARHYYSGCRVITLTRLLINPDCDLLVRIRMSSRIQRVGYISRDLVIGYFQEVSKLLTESIGLI